MFPRAAAALLAVWIAACGAETEDDVTGTTGTIEEPVVVLDPDDVAVARVGDLASGLVLTGTLEPYRVVEVKAQVAGTIQDLTADRGVAVRRGQRLATIEAEAIRSRVSGARASVAAADSAIAAAEANVVTAVQRLKSARMLFEAGAISKVEVQAAEAEHKAALGQLAAAEAQAAAARAQLAAAIENARRTTVEAPITGVVSRRAVSEGEAVAVGQDVFTIVNTEILELSGQVPVQQAARAHVGQKVVFTLDAYPGQVFTGEVARIDPVADPATRRVGIALQLPNPGGRLVAGQYVTGEVITANVERALLVPRTAIRGSGDEQYALLIEDGRVVRRPIVAGVISDALGNVAIESGLEPGDRVIVSLDRDIRVGARVRETGSAPAQAEE